MSNLYSFNNAEPTGLPWSINHASWPQPRTNPATFTTEELALVGYTGPYTKPTAAADSKIIWDGAAFVEVAKSATEAKAEKSKKIIADLAASDAEFSARWLEDVLVGNAPSAKAKAWIAKREKLRVDLAAVSGE